eukprot:977635-Pelagomonas_calceolata.AAC.2
MAGILCLTNHWEANKSLATSLARSLKNKMPGSDRVLSGGKSDRDQKTEALFRALDQKVVWLKCMKVDSQHLYKTLDTCANS